MRARSLQDLDGVASVVPAPLLPSWLFHSVPAPTCAPPGGDRVLLLRLSTMFLRYREVKYDVVPNIERTPLPELDAMPIGQTPFCEMERMLRAFQIDVDGTIGSYRRALGFEREHVHTLMCGCTHTGGFVRGNEVAANLAMMVASIDKSRGPMAA